MCEKNEHGGQGVACVCGQPPKRRTRQIHARQVKREGGGDVKNLNVHPEAWIFWVSEMCREKARMAAATSELLAVGK